MPQDKPISISEAKALFDDLRSLPSLLVAVSGGPDSTALLYLLARWRAALKSGPKLFACTIDHGLRKESPAEAKAAGTLARKMKVPHRILLWRGRKPKSGLQEAARQARYRLLADAASDADVRHIVTAHTLDDQAETVLIRLTRGSGITGLAGMMRVSRLPLAVADERLLVRPLLSIPKSRLVATLRRAKIAFADDPSNRNEKFTRVRLRDAAGLLEREGLSARRLSQLAIRARRADMAIEAMAETATRQLARTLAPPRFGVSFDAQPLFLLPEEIVLRVVGGAIGTIGNEGPVELGKLEALIAALAGKGVPAGRRTLAGAIVTIRGGNVTIERAPRRRAGFRP